jgi:EpsD family peptidyl-prolyl cis-trans isomerase
MKTSFKLGILASIAVLAACEKEATGQVAAVVNGEEITLQELNTEIEAMSAPETADKSMLQKAALGRIIERRLLAQEARKDGLDQSAEFLIRRRQMEDGLLVQLLGRKVARAADVPNQKAVQTYIEENPAMFSDRTVYTLDRIQFPLPADMKVLEAFENDHSMDAIAARLRQLGIEFTRRPGGMDSAQLGQQRMSEILSLPRSEPFIMPEGGAVTAAVITGETKQPIVGEQAQALAVQAMRNKGLMDVLQQRLKSARAEAKIQYQDGFAPSEPASDVARLGK